MAKVDEKVAVNFLELQKQLPVIIKNYGINVAHLCQTTKIPRSTFERKRRNYTFTAEELIKLCQAING